MFQVQTIININSTDISLHITKVTLILYYMSYLLKHIRHYNCSNTIDPRSKEENKMTMEIVIDKSV